MGAKMWAMRFQSFSYMATIGTSVTVTHHMDDTVENVHLQTTGVIERKTSLIYLSSLV